MELLKWEGGGIPFGYSFDKSQKKLVANDEEKTILKQIYHSALNNETIFNIVTQLNAAGYKSRTNKDFTYKTVSYLFSQKRIEFYSGFANGQKGDWEAIIDNATAKKLIGLHFVRTTGSRPRTHVYLLPGLRIANCGYCNATMKSNITRQGENIVKYYICARKTTQGHESCPKSGLRNMALIDNLVLTDLAIRLESLPKIEKLTKSGKQKENEQIDKLISQLSNEIQKAMDKQNQAKDAQTVLELNVVIDNAEKERRFWLAEKQPYNFTHLKKIKPKNLKQCGIEKQRELLKLAINKISIFNEYLTIEYHFFINDTGKTITIEF